MIEYHMVKSNHARSELEIHAEEKNMGRFFVGFTQGHECDTTQACLVASRLSYSMQP